MKNTPNHFLILGSAIVVMSSSGVLGTYITLDPPITIWIRCVLGSAFLFVFLKATGGQTFVGWGRDFKLITLSSFFLALHWITYFYALAISTIAVSMLSLFTYPVITAILEPIIRKKKFKLWDVVLALFSFTGVYFLIPGLDLNSDQTQGAAFGVLSAFLYSMRNILLSYNVAQHSGVTLMYYQLAVIATILWPVLFFFNIERSFITAINEWDGLLTLGIVTTAIAHTLFVQSFKYFSITTVSIISNLTPVCGISLGVIFMGQMPEDRVYIGGAIILTSAMIESIRAFRR